MKYYAMLAGSLSIIFIITLAYALQMVIPYIIGIIDNFQKFM